jgi:hypothetical protein
MWNMENVLQDIEICRIRRIFQTQGPVTAVDRNIDSKAMTISQSTAGSQYGTMRIRVFKKGITPDDNSGLRG